MAIEENVNRGAYVQRVSRGTKRWFFSVSVPHDYLDWVGSADAREIANVLDKLMQAARSPAAPPGSR